MTTVAEILPPRYRLPTMIGRGGMAEVYRATDEALGREVAVKVLDERYVGDEAFRARFTREALAAARLSGKPHTVTIFDVGEWNGRPYIVMEHAAGGTVADRARRGPVEPVTALRWIEQAALALDTAHAHGIVHRDVKPAKLLLAGDGTLRMADFGIASAAGLSSLTEPGTVLGTLGYLAPEQAAGEATGPAADRYALAVVAYELLSGRRPYESSGAGPAEALAAGHKPPPRISAVDDTLPRALDAVFERALSADPARRYGTCAEFVDDVQAAFAQSAAAAPAWPPAAAARPARVAGGRSWWPAALLLVALGGAGVGGALLLDRGEGAAPQEPPIRTITARGSTVTVTTAAPTTVAETAAPQEEAPPPPPAAADRSGAELNDEGYRLMQAGDYGAALPLFEQAVQVLSGTGSITEAYALYNLAFTRFARGRCDGVAALLARSERIQGYRSEIVELRREVRDACR